ncbi:MULTISPECIES: SdrD B-like domain-containing protein [Amycolatopsis]|uniref:SdrD B-like domain-containing protein n=1 Tax=Amycolatopsis TaxID=1813 RepID=UPI001E55CF67|nr:SdrD B-like domain-containing protein [Amycolatopsis bullii]
MSRTPLRGVRRLFAVLTAVLTTGAFVTPAAHADGPSLLITASVGAEPQLVGKPFPITLTLTNTTDQPLTKVTLWDEHLSGSWLSVQDWAGLGGSPQAGVTLDAGATRTFTITAAVWTWNGVPHERFRADWTPGGELVVPLIDPTTTHGAASGVVYGDRNENGTFDPGEGLPGATAYLYGTSSGNQIEATTDADGRFSFTDLPAQRYGISTTKLPDGWIYDAAAEQRVDVDGSDPGPAVALRAVRPFSEKLHATGSFDRGTYQVGDTVQVTLTLTNVSGGDLHGISAGCDRVGGSPDHLLGWEAWDDITAPGAFDLAAGETRTFTETGTVPTAATTYGGFRLSCDFGTEPGPLDGRPTVDPAARVAAPPGTTAGVVYHDDNANYTVDAGEAIAGTAVELVDRVDGSVTATAVSDAQGHVAFGTVPAGPYRVRIAGWRAVDADQGSVSVGTCWYCGEDWALRYQR